MSDRHLERAVLVGVMAIMIGLSIWLQLGFLDAKAPEPAPVISHDPDYTIHNFTATGRDSDGIAYVLKADRLVHFPDDNTAELDQPHLVQYEKGKAMRTTFSESGRVSADGTEVLLSGNVRMIQNSSDVAAANETSTDRMTVRLKRKPGS